MDIQAIVHKITEEAQNAPELLQEFTADPGAAIEKLTGDVLGDTDISAVAEGVLSKVQESGGDLVHQLSGILESGAVHDVFANITSGKADLGGLLGSIFGGGDNK